MANELQERGKEAGLKVNTEKTNFLTNTREETSIQLGEEEIEKTDEMVYLGQSVSMEGKMDKEINRRVTQTWNKYWSLKYLFKGHFNNVLKSNIFNANILTLLTYASQTGTQTNKHENLLTVIQNSMEQSMLTLKRKDKVSIKTIRNRLSNNNNIITLHKCQKWNCAGHVARLSHN